MYQPHSRWPIVSELLFLFVAAPLLYFADRFQPWGAVLGFGLLSLSWIVRGATDGSWFAHTPANAALWFWLLVMLPIAIWAAPNSLREQFSWPRTYIVIWNFCLYHTVAAYASRSPQRLIWALSGWVAAAVGIALVAPFGMEQRSKIPGIGPIVERVPQPLAGVFSGAEGGFSTNQLAGALLYVLPVLFSVILAGRKQRTWIWWGALLCSGITLFVMVLAQSRGGLLGLIVAIATILLLSRRNGWLLLGATGVIGLVVLYFLPGGWVDLVSDAPVIGSVGGITTVSNFRAELWKVALLAIRDFFYTGMGFGTFRTIAPMIYRMPVVPPNFDFAHAHNFFLQTALDFGVPGLASVVAIYLVALVDLYHLAYVHQTESIWPTSPWLTWRVLAIGWMGVWVGQSVYSMLDAVAVGSKPSFLWWMWFALIFAAGNLALRQRNRTCELQ